MVDIDNPNSFHVEKQEELEQEEEFVVLKLVQLDYYREYHHVTAAGGMYQRQQRATERDRTTLEDYRLMWSSLEGRVMDDVKVPVVRMFGVTPQGCSMCVHVHGAFPYFYVAVKEEDVCDGQEGGFTMIDIREWLCSHSANVPEVFVCSEISHA